MTAGSIPALGTLQTCPRGAARSARLPVTQEVVGSNPIGDALTTARYANRKSGEAQTFVIVCGFDSLSRYSKGGDPRGCL